MPLLEALKGYRKLAVSFLTLGLSFWLAMELKLTDRWAQIAIAVVASFSAANAFEHSRTTPK